MRLNKGNKITKLNISKCEQDLKHPFYKSRAVKFVKNVLHFKEKYKIIRQSGFNKVQISFYY